MIEKLIYQSRTTEVDSAATLINGAYENTGLSTDNYLAAFFNSLLLLITSLGAAIKRMKAESELEEKDEVRDDNLRGLNYMLLGYLHNPTAAIRDAAQQLMTVFENYGLAIVGESYGTESSLINSLLTDLAAPALADSIALLPGCAEQIAALQASQDDFEAVRIAYDEERGEESTEANATTLKKEVVKMINDKLVGYLRAMMQADEATYGDFGRTVGQIIADNNEVVKRRRKKTEA